ncbi:MAG: hypothetical protein M3O31_07940 [Acidobacteriota bacterium]|nr:hypothetical protein [Acidobacteriota bacterium]
MIQTLPPPTGDTKPDPGSHRDRPDEDTRSRHLVRQASAEGAHSDAAAKKAMNAKVIFFLGLLLAASGLVSTPVALIGGIVYGFTVEHPLRREASALAKLLLQASVVLLGFGMNLEQVIRIGKSGFLYSKRWLRERSNSPSSKAPNAGKTSTSNRSWKITWCSSCRQATTGQDRRSRLP